MKVLNMLVAMKLIENLFKQDQFAKHIKPKIYLRKKNKKRNKRVCVAVA